MTAPLRPFRVVEIDHVVLRVADLAASLRFYCEALGCVPERELPDPGLYKKEWAQKFVSKGLKPELRKKQSFTSPGRIRTNSNKKSSDA